MLISYKCRRRGAVTGAKAKAGETEPDAKNALKHLPMEYGINMI